MSSLCNVIKINAHALALFNLLPRGRDCLSNPLFILPMFGSWLNYYYITQSVRKVIVEKLMLSKLRHNKDLSVHCFKMDAMTGAYFCLYLKGGRRLS